MTAFVDPIDGTREFATARGEYVTILLGFNDDRGVPQAGIMYRPLTEPQTWAAGAASENCVMGELDMAETPNPKAMLVTDGKVKKGLAGADQMCPTNISSFFSNCGTESRLREQCFLFKKNTLLYLTLFFLLLATAPARSRPSFRSSSTSWATSASTRSRPGTGP